MRCDDGEVDIVLFKIRLWNLSVEKLLIDNETGHWGCTPDYIYMKIYYSKALSNINMFLITRV